MEPLTHATGRDDCSLHESPADVLRNRLGRQLLMPAALTALMFATVSGCGSISSAQKLADRAGLATSMAKKVAMGRHATFQASYAVTGNGTVTVVQSGSASAFISRSGRLITTGRFVYLCSAGSATSTCQRTATAAGAPDPATALGVGGFVSGEVALGVLSAAMIVPKVTVTSAAQTVAGQSATCVTVSGLDAALNGLASAAAVASPAAGPSSVTLCVTDSGVLARFAGSLGNGTKGDVVLTHYSATVNPGLLRPPKGAKITS